MANPERGFLNPRFLNSKTGRVIGAGVVAIGSTIAALPLFDHDLTRAEVKSAQSESFKKAAAERLQYVDQSVIEFTIGNDHYMWDATNASYNINPPNELVIPTATVRVAINGTWLYAKRFQGLQSLYSGLYGGILTDLSLTSMAVDVPLDRYYLLTATARPLSNIYDAHLELGIGVAVPESYTGRQMVDKGLPTGGIHNTSSFYVALGRDAQGNWFNVMFDNCVNPLENGTYQIRRDNLGNPIGDTFIKLSSSIVPGMPYQAFLPITLR